MYLILSIMLKEKFKPSHQAVITAINNSIGEAYFKDDDKNLHDDIKSFQNQQLETAPESLKSNCYV